MAGRHPWRELRARAVDLGARAEATARLRAQLPPEGASPEQRAADWLGSAADPDDYADARRAVRAELGLNPDTVPHAPPPGWVSSDVPADED